MNVVILSARTGWHTDELCRALAERGHVGRVAPYESLRARIGTRIAGGREGPPLHPNGVEADLSACAQPPADKQVRLNEVRLDEDVSVFEADAVLARIIPEGSLEQIIYRVDALHWIEERGIPVMNSARAIERSVDKFYTTALLHEAGLPVPETVVCERGSDAMLAVRGMLSRGDVIIKPVFGSMGHGMVRVGDADVAFRVVRSLEQIRAVFYLQRAIDHGGCDVRVFVVGGRAIGAIERTAPAGEWRTNVARGGSAKAIDLPVEWERLALRATAAVGADYAGVDLLPSRGGEVFVLEVNGIPGWQGLQQAAGLDVAGAVVDHLMSKIGSPAAAPAALADAAGLPA
jgi:RimK family alpha-L-glutamate ligase